MTLKIYLFRHGQTFFNRDHRFTGFKDSKLTPLGVRQARKIANKLRFKKIDVAFYTHLSRSKDTLKEVLRYHKGVQKIKDDRMIERSYGSFEGLYHKTIIKKYGKNLFDRWHRSYNFPPPKGESIRQVEKRVISFIRSLIKMMREENINVAISAHGNSMRPFRRYFEKLTIKQMMNLENPWDEYFEYTVTF